MSNCPNIPIFTVPSGSFKNNVMNAFILENEPMDAGNGTISTTGSVNASSLILNDVCSGSTNMMTLSSVNGIHKIMLGTQYGVSGQVLTSGGTGSLYWGAGGGGGGSGGGSGTQALASVLTQGSIADPSQTITLSGNYNRALLNETSTHLISGEGIKVTGSTTGFTSITNINYMKVDMKRTGNTTLSTEITHNSIQLNNTTNLVNLTGSSMTFSQGPSTVSLSLSGITYQGTSAFTLGGSTNYNFTITPTAPTPLSTSANTTVATTGYVDTSYVRKADATSTYGLIAGQTWTGTHAFDTLTATTPLSTSANTTVATTGYVDTSYVRKADATSTYGLIAGQTWTGTHSFSEITTPSITSATPSSIVNLYTNQSTGNIIIGNSGVTTTVNGTLAVGTSTTLSSTAFTTSTPDYLFNGSGNIKFNTSPSVPVPTLGPHATTKEYVDTVVGNYGGNGLALYFNTPTPATSPSTGTLSNVLNSNAQVVITKTIVSGDNLIATFTTSGYPNTSIIPIGLWTSTLYGSSTSATGTLQYYFKLYKVVSGTSVLIGTSGYSYDINSITTNPGNFYCTYALTTEQTMNTSDLIRIEIYCLASADVPVDTVLSTYFQGSTYSFITTSLNGGVSLLTTTNSWNGTNTFLVSPVAPTPLSTSADTTVATTLYVDTSYLRKANALSTYGKIAGQTWTGTHEFDTIMTPSITSATPGLTVGLYTNQTTGGTVTISNTGVTTNIKGILRSQDIRGITPASSVNLYTDQTTGNISIGSTTITTNLRGILRSQDIRGITPASSVNLYTDQTTGNISIGNTTITTFINGGLRSQDIRGITPASSVNLYVDQTTGGNISIGNTTITTNLRGILRSQDIRGITPASSVNLYTDQTTGGTISIGNTGVTTVINGNLRCQTIRSNVSSSLVNLYTDQVTGGSIIIGNSAITTFIGGTLSFGTSTSLSSTAFTTSIPDYLFNGTGNIKFNTSPSVPEPTLGSHATTKNYVDLVVGSGGTGGTSLLTTNNSWSGTNTFGTLTATTPVSTSADTTVATTSYVDTSYLRKADASTIYITLEYATAALENYLLELDAVSIYGRITNQTWSGSHNFTGATLTSSTPSTNIGTTVVATTGWVNNYFGKVADQTWTGTHAFSAITSSSITSATPGSTVSLYTNQTTGGTVTIGSSGVTTAVNGTLNAQTIKAAGTTLDVNLYTDQTGGIITLGNTGVTTAISGTLNAQTISAAAKTTAVGLYTDQTGGIITLGNTGVTTAISGTLNAQTISAATKGSAVGLYTDQTGGIITLGNTGVTTAISGTLNAQTISAATKGSTVGLYTDQSAGGNITIGSSEVTTTVNGTLSIGTPTSITPTAFTTSTTDYLFNGSGNIKFNTSPSVPGPTLGSHATTKEYVDTVVGNYGGNGVALYFNTPSPATAPSTGTLSNLLNTTAQAVVTKTIVSGDNLIATFTTTGYPNTTLLPIGLWTSTIYGASSSATGTLQYFFKLYKVVGSTPSLIGTSGYSYDINSITTNPGNFYCTYALTTEQTLNTSDLIQIEIYCLASATVPVNTVLSTYFQGSTYSFITTSLNGGVSLLTTTNSWNGTNTFSGITLSTTGISLSGSQGITIGGVSIGNTSSTLILNSNNTDFKSINSNIKCTFNNNSSNKCALEFYTYNSSPTVITGSITCTNGGSITNSSDMAINCTSLAFNSGATFNSAATFNTDIIGKVTSGTFKLFSGDVTIDTRTTTVFNLSFTTIIMGTTYFMTYNRTAACTMNLSDARDGNYFYVINQGTSTITITTSPVVTGVFIGPAYSRNGVNSVSMTQNTSLMIRCLENVTAFSGSMAYVYYVTIL